MLLYEQLRGILVFSTQNCIVLCIQLTNKLFTMATPKSRKRLTVKEKLEAAIDLKNSSQAHVMEKWGISRRMCSTISSSTEELMKAAEKEGAILTLKSMQPSKFEEIDGPLLKFIATARRFGLFITREVIRARALFIQQRKLEALLAMSPLSFSDSKFYSHLEKFTASDNWLRRFIQLHGLKSVSQNGEAGSVSRQNVAEEIAALSQKLQEYSGDNIYSMGETGLFYKCLPKRTRGTKALTAKDRITLIVTTNATGTHILPPTIVGSAKEPRCFRIRKCPLPYLRQRIAWNDGRCCREWFIRDFLPLVRKRTSEPVALVMGHASSHPVDGEALEDPQGQVKIFHLPPNCTAVYQPMDQGIIACIKSRYKHALLRKTVELFESRDVLRRASEITARGTKGIYEGHPAHMLDAAEIVDDVYRSLSPTIVQRCWMQSCILPPAVNATLVNESAKTAAAGPTDSSEVEAMIELMTNFRFSKASSDLTTVDREDLESIFDLTTDDLEEWIHIETSSGVQDALQADALEETMMENDHDDLVEDSAGDSDVEALPAWTGHPSLKDVAKKFAALEKMAEEIEDTELSLHLRRAKKLALLHVRRGKVYTPY